MRFLIKIFLAALVLISMAGAGLWWWASQPLTLRSAPVDFRIAAGSSLRTAIAQMKESGIEVNGFLLALLARVQRADTAIKAGSFLRISSRAFRSLATMMNCETLFCGNT